MRQNGRSETTDEELQRLGMMRVQVESFTWVDDPHSHAPVPIAAARRQKR